MKKKQGASSVRILEFSRSQSSSRVLDEAIATLRLGGLIAFPTDTFYALGADPFNEKAVGRIFEVKGRETVKPIPVVVADIPKARALALDPPPSALRLMERFWPGPLTLLLAAGPKIASLLLGGTGKIAVRVPDHPSALSLLEAWGGPITATSANRAGGPDPSTAEAVAAGLGGRIDLILDAGPTRGGPASTIVDATLSPPRLVRAGAIPFGDVMQAIGITLTDEHDW